MINSDRHHRHYLQDFNKLLLSVGCIGVAILSKPPSSMQKPTLSTEATPLRSITDSSTASMRQNNFHELPEKVAKQQGKFNIDSFYTICQWVEIKLLSKKFPKYSGIFIYLYDFLES